MFRGDSFTHLEKGIHSTILISSIGFKHRFDDFLVHIWEHLFYLENKQKTHMTASF